MDNQALTQLLSLDGEERYDHFLSLVAEEREIWILVNSENRFLKIASDEDGMQYLPVWPAEVFALNYAQGSDDLTPLCITLPDFFRKWVPGLSRDGLEVGVFPGLDSTLWITEAEELKRDLQDAMSDF
ncbi:MAG: DUF2750 domain-containing protein [Marinobacter sp.]|nr:DUF2750 domain-containing protein [Marinobacter sp.]